MEQDVLIVVTFLVYNVFVWWTSFLTNDRHPMGTHCAPLSVDLFPHWYKADFKAYLMKKKNNRPARSFNLNFLYIDVLSLDGGISYIGFTKKKLEIIKYITYTIKSAPYLTYTLNEIDGKGKLLTNPYDKRGDFRSTLSIYFRHWRNEATFIQQRLHLGYHNSYVMQDYCDY